MADDAAASEDVTADGHAGLSQAGGGRYRFNIVIYKICCGAGKHRVQPYPLCEYGGFDIMRVGLVYIRLATVVDPDFEPFDIMLDTLPLADAVMAVEHGVGHLCGIISVCVYLRDIAFKEHFQLMDIHQLGRVCND